MGKKTAVKKRLSRREFLVGMGRGASLLTVGGTVGDSQGSPLEGVLVEYYAAGAIPGVDPALAHDITDAVVRLIVRMKENQELHVRDRDVRGLLSDARYVAGIVREVEREARLRLGNLAPEELTDRELLARYLEAKGAGAERTEVLLQHAEAIVTAESK